MAWAQSNEAFVEQIGLSNALVILQNGQDNTVGRVDLRTRQDNDLAAAAGNSLEITQDGFDEAGTAGLGIAQIGSENTLTIEQESSALAALPGMRVDTVLQTGIGNAVVIRQDGDGEVVDAVIQDNRAFASSDSDGNGPDFVLGNTVEITQIGTANGRDSATAEIRQFGWQNISTVFQAGTDGSFVILQEGDANELRLDQFGGAEIGLANAFIVGNENDIDIEQDGVRPVVEIDMVGSLNEFDIEQSGGTASGNLVRLNIIGSSNGFGAGFTVGGPADLTLDDILASSALGVGGITQRGENNSIDLAIGNGGIDSDDNLVSLAQIGDDNRLAQTVQGDANQSGMLQLGDANTIASGQFGDGNNLGISQ